MRSAVLIASLRVRDRTGGMANLVVEAVEYSRVGMSRLMGVKKGNSLAPKHLGGTSDNCLSQVLNVQIIVHATTRWGLVRHTARCGLCVGFRGLRIEWLVQNSIPRGSRDSSWRLSYDEPKARCAFEHLQFVTLRAFVLGVYDSLVLT